VKTIKIISTVAGIVIISILVLAVRLEDPLKEKYRDAVENLKETPGQCTTLTGVPVLQLTKEIIDWADRLKAQIYSRSAGFDPPLSKSAETEYYNLGKESTALRQQAWQVLSELCPEKLKSSQP
jgi:hypothetical protein